MEKYQFECRDKSKFLAPTGSSNYQHTHAKNKVNDFSNELSITCTNFPMDTLMDEIKLVVEEI